jgi:hypothetical protein
MVMVSRCRGLLAGVFHVASLARSCERGPSRARCCVADERVVVVLTLSYRTITDDRGDRPTDGTTGIDRMKATS